ncbi:hypothetical protein POVCU1_043240 [Plasmodium ovale curtisi]|uniref:Uncharacterized protein n=1 Tax=Plasmodium ovale curtisi TaxID=864141 RepID=A0A1A8X0E3_PLAOA|nr:hypothetical protein POVCU1_043240 [Plasmodium ovale curtisi]
MVKRIWKKIRLLKYGNVNELESELGLYFTSVRKRISEFIARKSENSTSYVLSGKGNEKKPQKKKVHYPLRKGKAWKGEKTNDAWALRSG